MKKVQRLLLLFTLSIFTMTQAHAVIDANTMPVLNNAINGNVTTSGNTMNVKTQGTTGTVGQFDWTSFDLGSNKSVNWQFTAHSQTALNRVLGTNMSQIFGKLTSSCAQGGCGYDVTSKVILINPNGVLFGAGSAVNLNSFTVSTFDAVNAKNIKDMSASELATYKSNLTTNFGPNAKIVMRGSAAAPGNKVTLDNSTWNVDKSAAIVAKDIDVYKGSLISTSKVPNYASGNQSFSNLKLITSNGVEFTYLNNGYLSNSVGTADGLAGVDYKLNVGDSAATGTAATLESGNIRLSNTGLTANSTIKVAKAAVKGYKLYESARGDIYIIGKNGSSVDVQDSSLITYNTTNSGGSKNQIGGVVYIGGANGVNVKNTDIQTAYSTIAKESPIATENQDYGYSGDVTFTSEKGNVTSTNNTIASNGSVVATAAQGKITITNTTATAKNAGAPANLKTVALAAKTGVDVADSNLSATDNTTIIATAGDINLTNSKLNTANKTTLNANNTLIKDSDLTYKQIALHNGSKNNNVTIKDSSTLNDTDSDLALDVKGNLTIDNNGLKKTATTNQNSIKTTATGTTTVKNNSIIAAAAAIDMNSTVDTVVTGSSLTSNTSNVKLTAGNDVNLINATITANKDASATAAKNFSSNNSRVNGDTINLTATAQNASLLNNSALTAAKAVTVSAGNNILVDKSTSRGLSNTFTGANDVVIQNASQLNATNANNVTATNNSATISNSSLTSTSDNNIVTANNVARTYKATFSAAKDNKISAKSTDIECSDLTGANNTITASATTGSVKDTAISATNNNTISAKGKQTIQNSEVKGKNNTITSTNDKVAITNAKIDATVKNTITASLGEVEFKYDNTIACPATGCITPVTKTEIGAPTNQITAGGDVLLGDLVITPKTVNPEDTVTVITAGGDIKSGARVVYDDMTTVNTPSDTTGTIIGTGSFDTGKTKVYLNTPGNINLVLTNTDNQKAGLELNGNKVEMIAKDGTLSLSRVIAGDLYIDETNKYIAGATTLTAAEKAVDSYASTNPAKYQDPAQVQAAMSGRGYIKANRFNFDYAPAKVAVAGIYQGSFNSVSDVSGNVTGYSKHFINLDNSTTTGQFVLAYTKPFACDPPPIVIPDRAVDETSLTLLPLQNQTVSQVANIANNITDPSLNAIAAAAAINIPQEEQNNY